MIVLIFYSILELNNEIVSNRSNEMDIYEEKICLQIFVSRYFDTMTFYSLTGIHEPLESFVLLNTHKCK